MDKNIDNLDEISVPDIGDLGRQKLMDMVKGNGIDPKDVRVSDHQQNLIEMVGNLEITFQTKLKETKVKGIPQQGEEVASTEAVHSKIAEIKAQMIEDPVIELGIKEQIEKTPGRGWGLDGRKIAIDKEESVFYTKGPCHGCNGSTKVNCSGCSGAGSAPCGTCHGQGKTVCQQCNGARSVMTPDGQQAPCRKCAQTGMVTCMTCAGKKQILCSSCQGAKIVACETCGQTGILSNSYFVNYHAETKFTPDYTDIPIELVDKIDKVDHKNLVKDHYAEIDNIVYFAETEELKLINTYHIVIPYGDMVYSLDSTEYPAFVMGFEGKILEIDYFLDPLLKPGVLALKKITEGPMATDALIEKATSYRIIRQVLRQANHKSKKFVLRKLLHDYPLGLSEKYAKAAIVNADRALKKITQKPRFIGMAISAVLTAGLSYGWLFQNMRGKMLEKIPEQQAHLAHLIDAAPLLGIFILSQIIITFMANNVLKKVSPEEEDVDLRMPKSHFLTGVNAVSILVIFLMIASIAPTKPDWFPM